jgi:protocatechuate 3,4-dioxygenase beta subunit
VEAPGSAQSPPAETPEHWTVSGRLLRRNGGAAEGVPVHLKWYALETRRPIALPEVRSGTDGSFRFSSVPPRDWFLLDLEADDPASALVRLRLWQCWLPDGLTTLEFGDIYLEPPQTLRVLVFSLEFVPVPGAYVEAERGVHLARQRIEQDSLRESRQLAEVTPGEYVLERAGSGDYWVTVRAEGFAFTPNSPARADVPQRFPLCVWLKEGGRITGIVRDASGAPIAGAKVSTLEGSDETASTGPDGCFSLSHLVPGNYGLFIEAEGFCPARLRKVATGSDDLVVTLAEESTIAGVVLSEENGRPIDCALVHAERREGPQEISGGFACTDAEGRFGIRGLSHGTFEVGVEHARFISAGSVEVTLEERQKLGGLVLYMRRGLQVSGRVTDAATGAPIPGARVTAYAKDSARQRGSLRRIERADGEGRFVLGGLAPGRYELFWGAPGYPSDSRRLVEVAEETLSGVELTLDRGGTIVGTVRDAAGAAVGGAKVSARPRVPTASWDPVRGHGRTTADASGRFQIVGLEPESLYDLEVAHGRGSSTLVSGVRAGLRGKGNRIEVVVPGGTVRGRVLDAHDRPVKDGWFFVRGVVAGREETFPGARTDENGAYETVHLPPGDYTFDVRAKDLRSAQKDVRVEEEGTAPVDFILQDGGSASGRVVDDQGRPVAGARVQAEAQGAIRIYTIATDITDEEGRFHLRWSDQQLARITADREGFESGSLRRPDGFGDTYILPRSAVIVGTVRSQDGDPVPEASVTAVRNAVGKADEDEWWDARDATTDSMGRFELRVGPGDHSLKAVAAGHATKQLRLLAVTPGERREGVSIEMVAAVGLDGQESGKPVDSRR